MIKNTLKRRKYMQIYVVTRENEDGTEVCAVFTREKSAKKFVDEQDHDHYVWQIAMRELLD